MDFDYIVYADLLWLINFVLDFALLWCTAKFGHFAARFWRLALAAVLGGIYGVGLVFPQFGVFYGVWGKLLFPLVMLLVAFGFVTWRQLLKQFFYLYLIGFAMSGAVLGGGSILGKAGFGIGGLKLIVLFCALVVAGFLGYWGVLGIKKNWQKGAGLVLTEIEVLGQKVVVKALMDTGNSLKDSLWGLPVVVVEYEKIKGILPPEFSRIYDAKASGNQSFAQLLPEFLAYPWGSRVSLIPYSAVGKSRGFLVGFRSDWIVFRSRGQVLGTGKLVLAICEESLGGNECGCLVNPLVLEICESVGAVGGVGEAKLKTGFVAMAKSLPNNKENLIKEGRTEWKKRA